MRPWLCLLCVWGLAACGGDDHGGFDGSVDGAVAPDAGVDAGRDECGEVRTRPLVYYGTAEPSALPLTVGQVQAVGTFGGCSGAFVAQEWVLTAGHCRVRIGDDFFIGVAAARPDIAFRAVEVTSHPTQDITLVRVDVPLSSRLLTAAPVAINTELLDSSRIGEIFEAAGYGTQEDGSSGEREFTAEPFDGLEGEFLVINGQGMRGVCFGDSGGPVMLLARDGTVRVAGDLSYGDPSCVGRDRFSRTDLAVDWIESHTGPTVVEGAGCGAIDTEGGCFSGTAVWCDGDALQSTRCDTCGWDAAARGFRCITGPDPCEGLDAAGACQGNVARWCEGGLVHSRDCDACALSCGEVDGLADCRDDPCGGLDYLGRCDGDVAVWCDAGMIRMRDCGAYGGRCTYIDDSTGYFCTR